jgi:2'-5' RNA ligase
LIIIIGTATLFCLMVRIFIAIDLPPAIRERIKECQRVLSASDAKLTMVNANSAHITLKFIGEVVPSGMSRIGTNNPRSPRVIWSNVEDGGACADLHRQIEEVLTPFGIPRENRPFTTHVTIARVKRPHPSLFPVLQRLAGEYLGKGEARNIRLKKSTLLPEGPRYEDLAEVTCT